MPLKSATAAQALWSRGLHIAGIGIRVLDVSQLQRRCVFGCLSVALGGRVFSVHGNCIGAVFLDAGQLPWRYTFSVHHNIRAKDPNKDYILK